MIRESYRQDRVFFVLFALLAALYVAPVLLVRYPPLTDYIAHARIVELWRHADSGAQTLLATEHVAQSWLQPYTGYHIILRGVSALLPLELANKLFLIFYVLALPLSFVYLLSVLGRDRRLALFCFPLIYNSPLIFGLLPQVYALPILVFAIARLIRLLEQPTLRRELMLAALTVLLFFMHLSAFFAFGLAAIVIFFSHIIAASRALQLGLVATTRLAVRRGLFTLPALSVALLWRLTSDVPSYEPVFVDLGVTFSRLFWGIIEIWPDQLDELLLITLFASALLLLMADVGAKDASDGTHTADWAVPAAGFVVLASAFCLPAATAKPVVVWGPNLRVVLPAVLLLLPLLRNSLRGKRALLLVPLLVMVLFHGVQINIRFVRFDRMARHIEPLLAAMKPNRRLLPLSLGAQDYQHNGGALLRLPELYQLRKGGFIPYLRVGGPAIPVRLKRKAPLPQYDLALNFDYKRHGDYDYFLVIWPSRLRSVGALPTAGKNVRLVKKSGRFALFESRCFTK
jgi:hypothetical protein